MGIYTHPLAGSAPIWSVSVYEARLYRRLRYPYQPPLKISPQEPRRARLARIATIAILLGRGVMEFDQSPLCMQSN